MRNKENIGHVVRGKRAVTSFSLKRKICTFYLYYIHQESKEKHKNKFLFFSNIQLMINH